MPGTVTTRTWLCSTCFSAREGCARSLASTSVWRTDKIPPHSAGEDTPRQAARLSPAATGWYCRAQPEKTPRRGRRRSPSRRRRGRQFSRRGDGNQRQGTEQGKPVFMPPALPASGRQSGDATGSAQARLRYAAHRAGRSECHPQQTAPGW